MSGSRKGFFQKLMAVFQWMAPAGLELWGWTLFCLIFGGYLLAKQEISNAAWKTTEGTVLDAQCVWVDSKADPPRSNLTVRVQYRYTVDGTTHEGDRLTTGDTKFFLFLHEAGQFRRQFPPGAKVTVYYAPYDPSQAALFVERGWGPWIALGVGVPSLLLTLFICWRHHRRGPEAAMLGE